MRRRVGPPRPVEDHKVPEELWALIKRPRPLIERLEQIRDSDNLKLHSNWRDTLDEVLDILYRIGEGD